MIHQTHLTFKNELKPRIAGRTKYIILHHSEVTAFHTLEDVHRWHLNKGWAGIGYHYFISKAGEIYEGRPKDTVGAHTYGYNDNSVGVCFEGNFDREEMGDRQLNAGIKLLCRLRQDYSDATIVRHGQLVKGKSCPGRHFPFDKLSEP